MTKKMMNQNHNRSLSVLLSIVLILFALTITAPAGAESVLPDHYHINIAMANGGEKYIKFDGGGLNALHISGDSSNYFGSSIASDSQSGSFFLTDTGGRGFDDDGILMLAVKGDVPDDFSVHIRASGYTWTPSSEVNLKPVNYTHVDGTVDSTFSKSDFAYGPQNWKPSGPANYPIYDGQDMSDTTQQFHLMFIDLHAGILGQGIGPVDPPLQDNGAIRVEYSFENMNTFAAFNTYAWCLNSNQGEGISWTNRLSEAGSSGFTVKGTEPTPTTEPTTPVETPTETPTVNATPTQSPTVTETTVNVTPTVTVTETTQTTTVATSVPTTTIETTTAPTVAVTTVSTTSAPVTSTTVQVTVSTSPAVTVTGTPVQATLTIVPSVTTTGSPEPSVSIPVLSTLFPSRVQTAVPTQGVAGTQVQSPTSGATTVGAGVPTVQASAVPSQAAQTIQTQSSSQQAGSSGEAPVSTGDSSPSSSSDDYTGIGGMPTTTVTTIVTTVTTTQTPSEAATPTPTLANTSTPVMTTPTPPFLDTGNQDEYSPLTIPGSSAGKTLSGGQNSQNFISTIQSVIDRLSSSTLSLLLLIGAVLLFILLLFAGMLILVLLLLLLLVGVLYLRQRNELEKKDEQNRE